VSDQEFFLEEKEKDEESENSSSNEIDDEVTSCARTIGISSIKKSVVPPVVSHSLPLGKRAGSEVDNSEKAVSIAKKFKTAESSEVSSSQGNRRTNVHCKSSFDVDAVVIYHVGLFKILQFQRWEMTMNLKKY